MKILNWIKSLFKKEQDLSVLPKPKSIKKFSIEDSRERQQVLVDKHFYGVLTEAATESGDNSVSFSKVGSNITFTGRGAYLFQKSINCMIFNMAEYNPNNNFSPGGLTDFHKTEDLLIVSAIAQERMQEVIDWDIATVAGYDLSKDLPDDLIYRKELIEYVRMYYSMIPIMSLYFYKSKDIRFTLNKTYRALFALIDLARNADDLAFNQYKDAWEQRYYEGVAILFHPLSIASYDLLRASVPNRIAARMRTMKSKTRQVSQGNYISPVAVAEQERLSAK